MGFVLNLNFVFCPSSPANHDTLSRSESFDGLKVEFVVFTQTCKLVIPTDYLSVIGTLFLMTP